MYNPFRAPTHTEYAETSLEAAKMTLLKALEQLEYYEAVVAFKRKQIARLEGAQNAKINPSTNLSKFSGISGADLGDIKPVYSPI